MKPILIAAIVLCSVVTAQDRRGPSPFEARIFKASDGRTMPYRLYIPRIYAKDQKRQFPLVLFLHGGAGRGADNLAQISGGNATGTSLWLKNEIQAAHPSFVLAPQCPANEGWARAVPATRVEAPLRLAMELLDAVMKEYRIDPSRVYVMGQSLGGFGTWAVLAEYPDKFAAGVPVCGGGDESQAARVARTPVWAFHGAADQTVRVERSRTMVEAVRKAGGSPKYTEYPGVGHNSWIKAFAEPELPAWLFSQRKPVKAVPGAKVEQRSQGSRPPLPLLESFDGLGAGFSGPQGVAAGRNPSDNSLAVGPDHIVEIVNSRMAVYTKKGVMFDTTGKVLYGAVPTNKLFQGFGGRCEAQNNGDAVVRYDQLAGRWLFVMPLFRRDPTNTQEPFSMCYAVTAGADPLGPYHRYEFKRKLFPDYPRPAVWPDGYYVPTSTGDDVIQKHACVVDRAKMLRGLPATEQCIIVDGVNFLNNADLEGRALPPPGAPNIVMATGGTQLKKQLEDDGIYAWKFHVDWETPANTKLTGPVKIAVAPYQYLCGGQLTNCVPQRGTDRRLDAQGDKIMNRLIYRNVGGRQSIVATHSVNTAAGGGGVRWYEFRLDRQGDPKLFQQGTYAPDGFYRWMASVAMDRMGNIGVGYSFGGSPNFPGQRFAARLAGDPKGLLTFQETVLVEGQASQTNAFRWEDYTTTAMDPTDDCTIWYVGDYIKAGASTYTTRIGSFRVPGCGASLTPRRQR